jgi:NAD(P)-dependent dehydrogenase (short-subunit alcohol dehydrogenase family)
VTGGANGIGYAIAELAGANGMTVVLADIDASALERARTGLAASGVAAHAFEVDVSDRDAVTRLAARVESEVGEIWLLVNNAGVFLAGSILEMPPSQWEFLIGVNLWGVVHGLQAFLPGMVSRDSGHVVNTGSVDGLVTVPNASGYVAAKHGVVALSECVYRDLEAAGSRVGVSVLCPGAVRTGIVGSARHWPARLGPPPPAREDVEYPELNGLMAPREVAELTFDAIAQRRFWILTHLEQYTPAILARAAGIVDGSNPDDATVDPNFRSDSGRVPS